jgi:hypothetical protein
MASNEENRAEVDQGYDRKKFWLVRKKALYIVLFVILAPSIPIFIWLFSEMHAAGKALDAFSQRLVAKDYDSAYSATSPEFQAAISRQDFAQQQITLCTKLGSLKAVTRGGSETNFDSRGGFTTVDTTFIFENAEREFSFKLKRVSGSWRVYGYREE